MSSLFHAHTSLLSGNPLTLVAIGAIWHHRSWLTLVQVMTCFLTAPSHYLSQGWLINNEVLWYSSEGNFTGNYQNIYPWYGLENHWFKITVSSPRNQWVNYLYLHFMMADQWWAMVAATDLMWITSMGNHGPAGGGISECRRSSCSSFHYATLEVKAWMSNHMQWKPGQCDYNVIKILIKVEHCVQCIPRIMHKVLVLFVMV